MSLSKTLYALHRTGSTEENRKSSQDEWKVLTKTSKQIYKNAPSSGCLFLGSCYDVLLLKYIEYD